MRRVILLVSLLSIHPFGPTSRVAEGEEPSQPFVVALIQKRPSGHDAQANRDIGDLACREAAKLGADVALFPEMWNVGYTRFAPDGPISQEELFALAVPTDGPWVRHFADLARELRMAIAMTYMQKWDGPPRNVVTLFDLHGREVFTYAKVHTSDFKRLELEMTPGEEFFVGSLETKRGPVKVGAMICFDREQPESGRLLMLQGAEIVLTPNSCKLDQMRLDQFKVRAWENMFGVAMTNYPSPKNNGRSVAYGADGQELALAEGDEEISLATFDVLKIRERRERGIHGDAYRRPHRYRRLMATEQDEVWHRQRFDGSTYQRDHR